MAQLELDGLQVLILSILVLWTGVALTGRLPALQRLNLPPAVTGGVACAVMLALLELVGALQVQFELALRDELLLLFFATIGLQAKLARLKSGGPVLLRMLGVTVVFLLLQNLGGVATALALGEPAGFGLMGGSVSLAGGHGTAITWGTIAVERGAEGALEIGLAFATFGLILGGCVGGPLANNLIRSHGLKTPGTGKGEDAPGEEGEKVRSITTSGVINAILMLAICVGVGAVVNAELHSREIILPGFLTAMATGIVLTNLADWRGWRLDAESIDLFNDVSLHLYLTMSLMSMALIALAGSLGTIAAILLVQVGLIVFFARQIVFRVCGGDYTAAVAAGGFAGLGLGATPIGVANMSSVARQYGPAPQAMLIIPLIGAFFLDIANAGVIQLFVALLTR